MAASPQESHRARFLEQTLERNPVHRDALRVPRGAIRGHLLLRGLAAIFKAPFDWRSPRRVTEESA